jgi:hypothetical protein
MLVDGSSWEPEPPPDGAPARRSLPRVPWRPFAWLAAFLWLLFAAGEVGGVAGYGLVLAAVALGCWRIDRWMGRWDWSPPGGSGAWH